MRRYYVTMSNGRTWRIAAPDERLASIQALRFEFEMGKTPTVATIVEVPTF